MRILLAMTNITVILSLASCSGLASDAIESLGEMDTPGTPSARPPGGSGTLAYIGADGNIWTTSLDGERPQQVTSDATAPAEGEGRSYHRVAWLPDGSLAFAAVVRSGDDARGELFLQTAPGEPPRPLAQNDEHFFIYLYGAPAPCSKRSICPTLAYLIEEENGVGLHLIARGHDRPEDLLVAVGRSCYLSWSPDGRRILWHTGGTARDNPAAELGLYHIEEDRRRILPHTPGAFLAPAWSPQGEDWLGVVAAGGTDSLQHITADEIITLATADGREIAFVWSPDGRRIAYAVRRSDNTDSYDPVHVIDLETRKTRQLTSDVLGILGFFWSPDGHRLAYLSRLDLPEAEWMQWRTVNLADDGDRGFAAFHPTPLMRSIIQSFNQYAQSHLFWSPDGRYLVYAEEEEPGVNRVWLVDTRAERGGEPLLVDKGTIGIWSWR